MTNIVLFNRVIVCGHVFVFNQMWQCVTAFNPWTISTFNVLKNENILVFNCFPFHFLNRRFADLQFNEHDFTRTTLLDYSYINEDLPTFENTVLLQCNANILKTIFGLPVTIDSVFKMEENVTRFGKLSLRQSLIWQSYCHVI